ncbi:integral membrane protein DUF92-domain-containing protein [Rhodofomes roseus]|uniref:Integral membrane protein DUF92-domain-containing protein n=1 Tax=Rhodofomes roseus TaxID=34475 RepID=A0ABQ8KTJ5_9APHY|nr:integral membrane protein DUF92-domain-containing protein [Rhodofomes roseus]KAH9842407.1 integral membrane protein DUF92-domain-containing protein [Rhodofomes roseus]
MTLGDVPLVPLLLAAFLGFHGLRKRSLSPSGALAAFVVGFSMMAVPLRAFGVSLITFYLVGSRATKVGKQLKTQFEDGHQEAGYRSAAQVLCNSASAFAAGLAWSALFVRGSVLGGVLGDALPPQVPYDFDEWCPLTPPASASWSRPLLFVLLGHFACCLGDTLASELGILSRSPPILITTLKTVPPGTNGGMSVTGTFASLGGGLVMGITLAISLLVESSACRAHWQNILLPLAAWGTAAGGLGSLLDSFMGATIQRTRFSNTTKRILTDESPEPTKDVDVKVVSGLNILTNNQVNLLSSIVVALFLGAVA